MARYFFHIHGPKPHQDTEGREFCDQQAAWSEASQLAKDVAGMLEPGQHWHLLVCDEREPVYAITVAAMKLGTLAVPVDA